MDKAIPQTDEDAGYYLPCIGGAAIPVITTTISHSLGIYNTGYSLAILVTLFMVVSAYAAVMGASSIGRALFLFMLFIPAGVIINIVADSYIWGIDHNLFPFEFIIYPAIAFFPVIIGTAVGAKYGSNKSPN